MIQAEGNYGMRVRSTYSDNVGFGGEAVFLICVSGIVAFFQLPVKESIQFLINSKTLNIAYSSDHKYDQCIFRSVYWT